MSIRGMPDGGYQGAKIKWRLLVLGWAYNYFTTHHPNRPSHLSIHATPLIGGGPACIWSRTEPAYRHETSLKSGRRHENIAIGLHLGVLDRGNGLVGLAGKKEGGSSWLNRLNGIGAAERPVIHHNQFLWLGSRVSRSVGRSVGQGGVCV